MNRSRVKKQFLKNISVESRMEYNKKEIFLYLYFRKLEKKCYEDLRFMLTTIKSLRKL